MELEKLRPVFEDYGKRLRAEGLKEGKAEGEKKARIEVAKTMLQTKRYSIEEVSEISHISMAEVKNIAVSYN